MDKDSFCFTRVGHLNQPVGFTIPANTTVHHWPCHIYLYKSQVLPILSQDTVNVQSFVCQHYMTLYLPFQQTLFIQVAVGRNHSADCWVVELRHPRHHLSMASRHEPYGSVCWWRLSSSVVPIRYDVFICSHRKYLLLKMLAVKKCPAQKLCICKKQRNVVLCRKQLVSAMKLARNQDIGGWILDANIRSFFNRGILDSREPNIMIKNLLLDSVTHCRTEKLAFDIWQLASPPLAFESFNLGLVKH